MATTDQGDWKQNPPSPSFLGSAVDMKNPVLSDTEDDPEGTSRGIMVVDSTSDISFITLGGTTCSFLSGELLSGVMYSIRIKRVRSTGTTMSASKIWLIY